MASEFPTTVGRSKDKWLANWILASVSEIRNANTHKSLKVSNCDEEDDSSGEEVLAFKGKEKLAPEMSKDQGSTKEAYASAKGKVKEVEFPAQKKTSTKRPACKGSPLSLASGESESDDEDSSTSSSFDLSDDESEKPAPTKKKQPAVKKTNHVSLKSAGINLTATKKPYKKASPIKENHKNLKPPSKKPPAKEPLIEEPTPEETSTRKHTRKKTSTKKADTIPETPLATKKPLTNKPPTPASVAAKPPVVKPVMGVNSPSFIMLRTVASLNTAKFFINSGEEVFFALCRDVLGDIGPEGEAKVWWGDNPMKLNLLLDQEIVGCVERMVTAQVACGATRSIWIAAESDEDYMSNDEQMVSYMQLFLHSE